MLGEKVRPSRLNAHEQQGVKICAEQYKVDCA
jgi:hypothetical protein